MILSPPFSFFFFFNDTATTEIYTLSLHDALPISKAGRSIGDGNDRGGGGSARQPEAHHGPADHEGPSRRRTHVGRAPGRHAAGRAAAPQAGTARHPAARAGPPQRSGRPENKPGRPTRGSRP